MTKEKKAGRRKAVLLVFIAAMTLEATALVQFYYSQKSIRTEATLRAESQLEATNNRILDVINQAEAAVRNSIWITQWTLEHPDSMFRVSQRLVEDNPVVVGSTVALVPGYDKTRPLFSPYVYSNEAGELIFRSLATEAYDYPSQEWFTRPLELGQGYWSEPYVDEGGGEMLMTTFSVPIYDRRGRAAAVLTADISLEWLSSFVADVKVYPKSFSLMLSRSGRIMVSPIETLTMKNTLNEFVSTLDDTTGLTGLSDILLSGESGNVSIEYKGATSYVYFSPVEHTGWSMSIVIPANEVFGGLRKMGTVVLLMQLLGLAMIIFMLRAYVREQAHSNDLDMKRERIQNELQVATGIQMSMVPKTFPPFPERHDLDMAATIVPAKQVGGDLYDFFIRDEKLFFCVGDVSGKGVPAALVMAVTRTTFRNISSTEDSPGRIVTAMNDGLSSMNDSNMFATFFCGVLDLSRGILRYCNAGHNPPRILTDDIRTLPVEPNLPLGIIGGTQFKEQEIAFNYDDAICLYTDGLTEAENFYHDQFGEERLDNILRGRKGAKDHLNDIEHEVTMFVDGAPQSDDLTVLFIHYLPSTLRITLPNDINKIELLPGFISDAVKASKLSPDVEDGLNLALEEAVTNVMLYAYPKGTFGEVNISATVTDKSLIFTISDNGKMFDPTKRPDVDINAPVEERPVGGLGILLIRKIMDKVWYERRGDRNVLILTKNY